MMAIPQFWFYSAAGIAFLFMLLCAEFIRAARPSTSDIERPVRWFNVGVLFILVLAMLYLTVMIELHRRRLDTLITPYPSARYAPERESFAGSERWIYITRDSEDSIILFYQNESLRTGDALVLNKGTTTSRLLFSRGVKHLFLTIENEGSIRVLYYAVEGDIRVVTH